MKFLNVQHSVLDGCGLCVCVCVCACVCVCVTFQPVLSFEVCLFVHSLRSMICKVCVLL